ncbi:phosphotransferase enzyme family protein [Rhizoctonia solani AG-3 Rhs1AP]|uniref:Phosphotransferase enzyme family protein n=1 Tax=Rhizoctonia solani AG-3 Rhs1AP TaxID=1086054 RepID=X8JGX8_9AGAM|nr:phosphotransferase enzyme family protein [Rhizoctonia solani AG-3 Rhs1AP]
MTRISSVRNSSTSTLPSPTGVLAEAYRMGVMNDFRPPPVHYLSLGLTVKYGRTVSTAEGQCMWAVRQLLGNVVPVPEVYGWTVEAGVSYIYMEHIPGETLSDRWDSLSESEKRDICHQLRTMVGHLRTIEQPNGEKFIGTVSRRPPLDHAFKHSCPMGPFTSVAEFHDLFAKLPWLGCDPSDPPHPFRAHLPDDVPIAFTHGDLHRGNIIVSSAQEGKSSGQSSD